MEGFHIGEMLEMQRVLQEKYKHKWEPVCPENGKNKVLWMQGEIGEVIDIIKKQGHQSICEDPEVRQAFVEELVDVLMYYNDIMLCYGITEEELKQAYVEKFERNMKRW